MSSFDTHNHPNPRFKTEFFVGEADLSNKDSHDRKNHPNNCPTYTLAIARPQKSHLTM